VLGLIARLYHGLRARHLTHFLAFVHPDLLRMLNAIRVPLRPLEELEPGPEELRARARMAGYFACGPVLPALCSLDEMAEQIGI
jgi:hypothetical protein